MWRAGKYSFDTLSYGIYLEDDMGFNFGVAGKINARFGARFDGDDYMSKHTIAPRFSVSYVAPWDSDYGTSLTFGANRYYGRNLFSYRLYAASLTNYDTYTRTSYDAAWVYQSNYQSSSYEFSKLRVPYDDELSAGFRQKISFFSIDFNYIYRHGRDEIMQRGSSSAGYYWTNEGSSKRHIFTLSAQNDKPLGLENFHNYFMFAFDWTQVDRSYNIYSADEVYTENPLIYYNGELIYYNDRPAENYVRPYTIRFNTIHVFQLQKMRFSWNNFFRYRASYERMVLCSSSTCQSYNPDYSEYTQYSKMTFKGAFTWDIRFGFEFDLSNNIFYANIDVYNILNAKNMTTLQGSGATGAVLTSIATSSAIPVYEVGRQAWIQVGYKF